MCLRITTYNITYSEWEEAKQAVCIWGKVRERERGNGVWGWVCLWLEITMLETWQQSHNDNNNEIKIAKLCVNKTRALDNARTHTRTHRKCNGCISSKMVANCVDIGIINIYGLWNKWAIERVCADADATLVCECRNSGNNNNNNNTAIDSLTNYAKNDIWYFGPLKMANIYRCTQWAPFNRFVLSFSFRSFEQQQQHRFKMNPSIHSYISGKSPIQHRKKNCSVE